mmetsp:Transcript_27429/g.76662  ORF Transcript_27429/g.76662 Transcript_27429/m.76662 type:complete len:299 (+) Transcript_27429:165-1061(+)|eukprot:CAMPEP_0119120260 /NCGR_PEP_ID=MMETSP1310-20130426/1376_1 /TAXON_ID=464262 /ORGANISM="Genus nov. species nov., Strain RCC2339" /LENGTH=298 /DNA_ID=CAMNT_0007109727 /DNA_START=147 /DNA_END=1043 /DNA_ORIENTATION=-
MVGLDIRLKKADRIYRQGEVLSGVIVVESESSFSHSGISMTVTGVVTLQLSAKSVGMFEAFYNSLKPIQIINTKFDVVKSGKIPRGVTELPFEVELLPTETGSRLFETYHGVFVNVQYSITCDMQRNFLAKNVQKKVEFILECPTDDQPKQIRTEFQITPQTLANVRKSSLSKIPKFKVKGYLESAQLLITEPLKGEVCVEESSAIIKSIELQLVRVETCGCAEGWAKEATEIQNIQIADGDILRGLRVPIHMVFPRLFVCPTVSDKTWKVEFEVNLVVALADGHIISENLPIKLLRN